MNNLISVLVVCGLVLLLFLGIFQEKLGDAILDKGNEVERVINGSD